MQGSKYAPNNVNEYGTQDLNVDFQGKQFNPAKNVSTNCDFQVIDDHLIDGGRLVITGATMGDSIDAKIVDIDNVLGYGANVILKTFITSWPVAPGSTVWDFSAVYPAKIYHGLYIRIVYNSVAGLTDADPKMAIGYKLHKILW